MNKLFFDIETLPAHEDKRGTLEFIFNRKLEKKSRRKKNAKTERAREEFEKYLHSTSFDGAFGRILCIGYAINDESASVICYPDDEKRCLEEFWSLAEQCDIFVGHNIMDFDLRFIYQRSVVLGVRPSIELSFARYRSSPIFDTMKEWSKWDSQNNFSLEHIALAMGIPTPKDGIDGSLVYEFYKNGKVKEICDYCARDVETTRKVYKKMSFN